MVKLTKFTLSPSGDLVYRKTGRLAPDNYVFRKNTVYRVGEDGVRRRVGTLSRKITKTEAAKISRAEKNREKRRARELTKPSKPFPHPRGPGGERLALLPTHQCPAVCLGICTHRALLIPEDSGGQPGSSTRISY